MHNPFRYSGPIVRDDPGSGVSYVERTTQCQAILRHIQQGDFVQIVGPHQSGKTTLAIDLISRLVPKPEAMKSPIPVLVSCEALVDACRESFVKTILVRLRRVMKEYLTKNTHAKLLDILAAPTPKTILDIHDFLVTFGDELRQSTEFSEIVIFLDEIESLPSDLGVDVLRLFRALFHYYAERRWESPYRVIILTTSDLSYWHLGASSPYNISNIVRLEPFSSEELDTMLDENHIGQAVDNVIFSSSSRMRIYKETGGHPYLIQRLCHILIERIQPKPGQVVLTDNDIISGVLELFEKGDKNLRGTYSEVPAESEEWLLCKRLAAGQREPFEADNPVIRNLAQEGVISDVDHYCKISAGIYERQILKRYFRESFMQNEESFADKERLLLHVSCLQKILLNGNIRQIVFARIEDLMLNDSQTVDNTAAELSCYLDSILKERESDFDIDEIRTYIDYYNMERIEGRKDVLLILVKAFVNCFNEIMGSE